MANAIDKCAVHAISRDVLESMSAEELCDFCAAIETVFDVVSGLCEQPRFEAGRHQLNSAGNALDALWSHLGFCLDAVLDFARTASFAKPDDIARVPFLNAYRTMCFAPEPDFRRVLEDIRELRLAAEPLSAESV